MSLHSPSVAPKEFPSGSGSGSGTYCRKQKSLGLLCSNFLSLYNQDGVETVGLVDAAAQLGVERRRIYDIVNVLESVGVLAKKAKNRYHWNGVGAIPKALQQLKEEGFRENGDSIDGRGEKVSDVDENDINSNSSPSRQKDQQNEDSMHKVLGKSKTDNRKEKSLGLLTRNFVKLFLCTKVEMLSLDDAAKILLGDVHDPSLKKTKIRRLYDIANVLSSMNFIEKIHHPETRKPAFRWLGMSGQSTSNASIIKDSKKRVFGTELTNLCLKRSKLVSPIDVDTDHETKPLLHSQGKCEPIECKTEYCSLEEGVKSYQFGPFAPKSGDGVGSNKVKNNHDWESLASTYRPQYHNQALRDLFVHYMDAWKSWYSEVAGMDSINTIY